MTTDPFLTLLRQLAADLPEPEPDRRSSAEIEAEDRLESIAEDRAFFGRWGGSDRDADRAALVEENRTMRAQERFTR